ncbi:dTDP-4-dehydrorhamnose reductase [Amycolatopsis sp. FDAARGOS 1241]|uniref:dTDP-4-dehydrorhamnose reductase n=1 Tax=Amycolatopsis sp. FDAARGOS 1241 TaxID=2778070 RepID=UPI00195031A6|nr:dTDP-4-dehydrorhamnose reductase [Amycolatopsis sp. FDAARGOS 1241]QRP51191.1 dTDP-4-dehydrorhamnose reductase [Amycolatopsis sp. FDAARGOS 1241]
MRLALLVPGGSGQLGRDLAALAGPELEVVAPASAELDVRSAGSVVVAVDALVSRAAASGAVPIVVNASAYTSVDAAEADEVRAFAVNADGPRVLAAVCSSRRVPLVHVSTDYVFPGDGSSPYEATDALRPLGAYGRTKAAGEDAVLGSGASAWVVRTSWVYGKHGANFVKTIQRLEGEREQLTVVDDQVGSPTWAADLAGGLVELARRIAAGEGPESRVLHCTGAGETSWWGFARAIFEEIGADPERVGACTTEEFPRPAPRPKYSVLSNASWRAAGLKPLRNWREALSAYFAE